jgi:hypothetical protein
VANHDPECFTIESTSQRRGIGVEEIELNTVLHYFRSRSAQVAAFIHAIDDLLVAA